MIQLNTLPGLFDPPMKKECKELPDNQSERVHNMMVPNPKEKAFIKEVHFNSIWLLATTLAFYIDRSFGKLCTMKEVREHFIVWTKQLSLCITGRKYLSGSERKLNLNARRNQSQLKLPGKIMMMTMTLQKSPKRQEAQWRAGPIKQAWAPLLHQIKINA